MNTGGKMSFHQALFPQNPRELTIFSGRRCARTDVPGGEAFVEDAGKTPTVVSGEGEFFGEEGLRAFYALQEAQGQGAGILYIPSRGPLRAVLEEWELMASDKAGVISYRFRFVEASDEEEAPPAVLGDGRSCLWEIAGRYGRDVGELLRKNPQVSRPDAALPGGRRVLL